MDFNWILYKFGMEKMINEKQAGFPPRYFKITTILGQHVTWSLHGGEDSWSKDCIIKEYLPIEELQAERDRAAKLVEALESYAAMGGLPAKQAIKEYKC